MLIGIRDIFLVAAALIPAVALGAYIYHKDRVEKEPLRLLALLLGAGVLCIFPAIGLELLFTTIEDAVFSGAMREMNGSVYMDTVPYYLYLIIENFFCVALVEEGLKWIAVRLLTANNKNFNSLFDGIVYCVFVSLGFAAAENVSYVVQYGFETAVARAFTAVPGHMFFAVIMGYYYSMWHVHRQAQGIETEMRRAGYIRTAGTKFDTGVPTLLSIALPVFVHGFYDYCCSLSSVFSDVLFYVMLAGLYAFCFYRISRVSRDDTASGKLAMGMVLRKYPDVAAQFGITQTPVYAADAHTGENRQAPYQQAPYGAQQPYGQTYTQQPPYGTQPPYGQTYQQPYGQQPPYGQAAHTPGQNVNPYSNGQHN